MHRLTMWIAVAVATVGLIASFAVYVNDTTQNPAVQTSDGHVDNK